MLHYINEVYMEKKEKVITLQCMLETDMIIAELIQGKKTREDLIVNKKNRKK